jgi:hypothetical protein
MNRRESTPRIPRVPCSAISAASAVHVIDGETETRLRIRAVPIQ